MPIRITGTSIGSLAIASASISSEVSVTATSSATAQTCMTLGPAFFEGGTYVVTISVPYLTVGTTNLDVELWVDGVFNQTLTGHMAASVAVPGSDLDSFVILAPGNHTITVRAFVNGGTGKFGANNGATGNPPNAIAYVLPVA